MNKPKLRIYKGIVIDRVPYSGLYSALVPSFGFVKADTLVGIKVNITQALQKTERKA